jgi:hypothetical protein
MDDLPSRFPTLAPESAGADCCGCIVPIIQGNMLNSAATNVGPSLEWFRLKFCGI